LQKPELIQGASFSPLKGAAGGLGMILQVFLNFRN
jgi:hypothetical protein